MRSKVLEIIARYWPDVDPKQVTAILDAYGTASHERERTRVQLAILKLSEGNFEKLPDLVKMAKIDYRDALAFAEYPEQMGTSVSESRKLPPEERKAIRKRDRQQYVDWLNG